jgi:hypothetical protein
MTRPFAVLMLSAALLASGAARALDRSEQTAPVSSARADFGRERPSADAAQVADWVASSGDSADQPFIIIDKRAARVFVFDRQARLVGATSALLGLALGDNSVPGIGQKKLSAVLPSERTTPAGRYQASLAPSLNGDEILWIDYDAAIALHRVIASVAAERRLQRLASLLPADRRITYGCINVPVSFFDKVVVPAFRSTSGVVYVLPEVLTAQAVFGRYGLP